MAMVSGNAFRSSVLLTLMVLSGCGAVLPMSPADTATDGVNSGASEEHLNTVRGDGKAYLPKQAYSAQGQKIPYVPSPNPYTREAAPVAAEARAAFLDAQALMASGDFRMARKGFWAMTKAYPGLSGPWVKLAALAERREKPEKAREYYQKALAVNPSNVNAYLEQAVFERRQGEFARARAAYLAALEQWKDFPEAHLNLAILYDLYMNQPEQAQPHYEAYHFLRGEDDVRVADWLIEIRRRTGIETSFIDNPPSVPELPDAPAGQTAQSEGPQASSDSSKEQG
ncbi:tetratricopeptide repeat protein [Marinobacter daepoensis]|uniref:tetratricopeptide repeat protein n=1 Tax=Marinobacter daepoensis TaxID=262077 RepID=UPI0006844728|nr:tetratricopeptide repeat protein [Marinobacter daepoensis]